MTQSPDHGPRARIEALTGITQEPARTNVAREAAYPNLFGLDRPERKAAAEAAAVKRAREVAVQMQAPTVDHGPAQLAALIVLEDVATGTRGTFKRARRRDNLAGLNLAAEEYQALFSWGVAAEKIVAGQGLGPMPWQRDTLLQQVGEALPAQMRALSSSEWHRIGTQAAGLVAHPVLCWVVLSGGRLDHYDATRRWRERTSFRLLCGAAERMAERYGFASRRSGLIKDLDGGRN